MSHSESGQQNSHAVAPGDFSNADILGSDVENISWGNLFDGLKVNGGIRFFMLFAAFTGWLYVVYWIRHHEPFSNVVIGSHTAQSSTASADRQIIARLNKVFPFQTHSLTGTPFYAPVPGGTGTQSQTTTYFAQPNLYNKGFYCSDFGEAEQTVSSTVLYVPPGQAMSAPLIGSKDQEFDQRFGSPINWRQ